MTFVGCKTKNGQPSSDQIILLFLPLLYLVQRQATVVHIDDIITEITCLFFDLPSLFSWKRTRILGGR